LGGHTGPTQATAIVGYAITGRAGGHGFLQRLAVHPAWQRRGVGRALVLDGLTWLQRRGVERVVVNTQLENRKALALYESLGFRREPRGLSVLSAGVQP
jgi:ribosomal protein S18 acetylase RimI-like enzyme